MDTANIRDLGRAQALLDSWGNKYHRAWDWIQNQQQVALRDGYVTTLYERKLKLPEESPDGMMRKGVNYPIQGSAAEILKRTILACSELDLALQVHDQLLADGYVEKSRLAKLETLTQVYTPIEVSYRERWE
jgi:DNA polymerase-1